MRLFIFGLLLCLIACSSDDEMTLCDDEVIVDQNFYQNGPQGDVTIIEALISEDCLEITFGASGCDGNSWVIDLVDSGVILRTTDVQRDLRLALENNESCLAYFTRTISFDITQLQVNDVNEITLKLSGFENDLRYKY